VKYLSILKDSLREALDSKLLYVTFGLSALLILFLASMSFRPVTMEEEAEGVASQMQMIFRLQAQAQPQGGELRCTLADFRQLNDAEEPWTGDYRFNLVLTFPNDALANTWGKEMGKMLRIVCYGRFWWLKEMQVQETKTANGREIRLEVTSHGTRVTSARGWIHEPALFFGAVPLEWFRSSLTYAVYWLENILVNTIGGWVIVLLGIVVTAFYIPNMLRKGTVDLLLSKPVTRPGLLVFKYLGGLTFLFLNTVFTIGGVWLVLGLRTGVWTWSFPVTVLILTFFFAVLYAISTLFGVLTRSTVVCILLTLVVWAGLFAIARVYAFVHPPEAPSGIEALMAAQGGAGVNRQRRHSEEGTFVRAVDVAHAILPRTDDLGGLSTQLISQELLSSSERTMRGFTQQRPVNWIESVGVSLAFIAVMLGLACWRFATKDY
jgi:ABC-type transport system involved in multi-copper enzyme maturation permease subunit